MFKFVCLIIMRKHKHTLTLIFGVMAFVFAALHFTAVPQKQKTVESEKASKKGIEDSSAKKGYTKMEVDYFLTNYNKPKNEIWVCYFWATWCMNCTRTHRTLSQLDQQFKASNVRLISLSMDKKKKSRLSGKEAADDVPSWAEGERPLATESGREFAKRLFDEKYGAGSYPTGPGSEFNVTRLPTLLAA